MQLRRYRYKLKVRSKGKEQKLWKFAGAYRLIYNLGLFQREFLWWQRRERTTYAKQCAELVELKKEFSWLCEIHSQVLQQALRDLDRAYRNYFAGRADHPKLKKKNNHLSFRYIQGVKISGNRIYLPKIGWFRIFLSREIPKDAEIGEVTVLKKADGWYAEDTSLVGIDDADINAAKVILQRGLAILKSSTAGLAGSDARGEGTGGGTAFGQVYESSLVEAGIPRL